MSNMSPPPEISATTPQPSNAELMLGISNILSQITEMRNDRKEDIAKQENINKKVEEKLKVHDTKLENAYKRDIKKNIVIYGWEDILNNPLHIIRPKVLELFSNKLMLKDIRTFDIYDIRIVGTKKNVLIVSLCSPYLARIIISNAFKLKGTKIFITSDASPEERAAKKKLMAHKTNLTAQGKTCKFKNDTQQLVVDGECFTLEQLDAGMGGSAPSPPLSSTENTNTQEFSTPDAGHTLAAADDDPDYEMSVAAKKRTPPFLETPQNTKKITLVPARIEAQDQQLNKKLEMRSKQFHVLLASIHEIEVLLAEDDSSFDLDDLDDVEMLPAV